MFRFLFYFALATLLGSCAGSKPAGSKPAGSKFQPGANNIVSAHTRNSRYSSSKADGKSSIVFKGTNNIINIDITDSDITAFNTKTFIIEGDNNNISSTIRKCVLVYQGRSDTVIIRGNELKVDFAADNMTRLLDGPGGTAEITSGQQLQDFAFADWSAEAAAAANDSLYVSDLQQRLTQRQAFDHYTKQAQAGNYAAFFWLGSFFDNLLLDVRPDIAKAMNYYEMAARHNHPDAAYRLGYIYQAGDFEFERIAIDRTKARYYYELAARNGHEQARERLAVWK